MLAVHYFTGGIILEIEWEQLRQDKRGISCVDNCYDFLGAGQNAVDVSNQYCN